jgi:hypothetical protein
VRVCVVGNGPSAPRYAAQIDACDEVIRLNAFPRGAAGRKWTIWASAFYPSIASCALASKMIEDIPQLREIWVLGEKPDMAALPIPAEKRLHIDAAERARMAQLLHARPSCGYMAVDAAYHRAPDTLCLVGFDQPFTHWWQDAHESGAERCAEVHNIAREHSFYADMVGGRGLGDFRPRTKVEWWQ